MLSTVNAMSELGFEPIGIVEKGIPRTRWRHLAKSKYLLVSRIRIFQKYAEGLLGLDDYSHLIVVWRMHTESEVRLRVRPWRRSNMPEIGIFASRFPPRPNHLGVTVAELIEMRSNKLRVRGLDAWTGSPVLDVKPYDYYDVVKTPRVPQWFKRYWGQCSSDKRYDETVPWLGP